MGFLDDDFIKKIINHNSEAGHTPRSPMFLFNQRASALAAEYNLKAEDITRAYEDRPEQLKNLNEAMEDSRKLKGTFTWFGIPVAIATLMPSPMMGVIFLAAAVGGGMYNRRKYSQIGETIGNEIAKHKVSAVAAPEMKP